MWKLRIKQHFQVQDYALWDVIENSNSFNQVSRITANAYGTSTSIILGSVTTEEKAQKKNDVKARSMLLMALPNEHLLTFSQYKDAKTLFEAIQARFSGCRKLLASWLFWRNKLDLEKMSFDDLYNNFKIVEQEVKRTITSSSSSRSQNMAFLSTPGSTNEVDTTTIQVSTVSTPISIVSAHDNTANMCDATVYAFLSNQPNGSQLVHEDLEQIHEDDLEEIDLKWQLALLSIRARRDASFTESEIIALNLYKMKFQPTWLLWLSQTQRIELNKLEFDLDAYKRGLTSVEKQLVFYKKNEAVFCDQIAVLKRDASFRESKIIALNL
nr:hypothetical protein [Tanacetum cinerariifolium]